MFEREIRLIEPVPKSNINLEVSFCYPGNYEIGMAGLGFQLVWWLMEREPDIRVRRCFEDIEEPLNHRNKSDLYGFTLSWELDILSIIKMLDRYSINRSVLSRDDDDPIVFAGGPVLSANPEPFTDYFDVILLGDAEATIPGFLEVARNTKDMPRAERLMAYSKEPGLYVPSLYSVEYEAGEDGGVKSITPLKEGVIEKPLRQVFKPDDGYVAKTCILSPDTMWGANYLIEVVRSCPQECRFCLASFLTRPFRYAPVDTIIDAALKASEHTDKVGLLGPSITEHPHFEEIAERLCRVEGLRVNIASVRADTLNSNLTTNINKLGQKSVTIALESGSQRLRDIMKKNLTEEEIVNAVNAIEDGGLSGVKFYGIAGLPFEDKDDLDETIRLMTELKKAHPKLKFVFGLSSFVPKAQTPFERRGRDRKVKKKMEYLRKHLAKAGIDVRPESHNWSDIQALLSRGDRRLTDVVNKVFDSGSSVGNWKKGVRANSESTPSFDYYVFDDYDAERMLAWSHLVAEEKRLFLSKHMDAAAALSQKSL